MDDENYKKAEKLANIAEKILLVSVGLMITIHIGFFISTFDLEWVISFVVIPLYIVGLVVAIIARNTCKDCAKAKKVLKCYIIISIVLIVLIVAFIIVVAILCDGCEKTFDCNGCFDTFLKCPG